MFGAEGSEVEKLVPMYAGTIYQTTRCHDPYDRNNDLHGGKNVKFVQLLSHINTSVTEE